MREKEVIAAAIQTCTATAFKKYAAELNDMKTTYDRQKVGLEHK